MTKESYQASFVAASGHWLELFDRRLALEEVPVHARPFHTAIMFLRDAVVETRNAPTENLYEQDWFASLMVSIRRWYVDRYGADAMKPKKDFLSGITLFRETPLRLRIPVAISKVEVEGEQAWMILPNGVHELEKLTSFFEHPPNIASLNDDEQVALDNQIRNVVRWSRTVNLAVMAADKLPPKRAHLPHGIWNHIERAVNDLLSLKRERAAAACWELHLAVEKALKVLLAQHRKPGHGHDLHLLADVAVQNGLLPALKQLAELPSPALAIKYRYGEALICTRDAVEIYFAALELVFQISSTFKNTFSFENPAFLLQKPKWVG